MTPFQNRYYSFVRNNHVIIRRVETFFVGLLFITVAAINTWQLAHQKIPETLLLGFIAAIIWSLVVKKLVFASWVDRIIYAMGAALGGVLGLYLVKLFYG